MTRHTDPEALKKAALDRLQASARTDTTSMPQQDVQSLIFELELHKAELEVQNEDLRRIEQDLIAARDQFRDLYEFAPVGYLTLDAERTIRQANLAVADLLNRERTTFVGKRLEQVVEHVDRDVCYRLLQDALTSHQSTAGEVRLDRADGQELWAQVQIVPLTDVDGMDHGFRITLGNMTARKQAEVALRQRDRELSELNQQLDQRVRDRTAELQHRTEQLRRLAGELTNAEHRERKRLASILHDDLQQFLVAARMQLGRARNQCLEPKADHAIKEASDCLADAINTSRSLTYQLRPPVLYDQGLVPALRWLVREMKQRHMLAVDLDGDDDAGPLDDNASIFLFECVRELLFNVVKHAGVDAAKVHLHRSPDLLRICVEDHGAGFQVARAAEETSSHGLFCLRERLTAYGGTMTTESNPGTGTRIELELPTQPPGALQDQAPGALKHECTPHEDKVRVMVVDDNAMVRQGIATMLCDDERIGHVTQAADGIEALAAMEIVLPDVIMIDINMPRMNGVDLTREVRRRWASPGIIALSMQDDHMTIRMMIEAGANSFISKVDNSEKMIAMVLKLARPEGASET